MRESELAKQVTTEQIIVLKMFNLMQNSIKRSGLKDRKSDLKEIKRGAKSTSKKLVQLINICQQLLYSKSKIKSIWLKHDNHNNHNLGKTNIKNYFRKGSLYWMVNQKK